MFMFIYEYRDTPKNMLDAVNLDSIPYVEIEDKYSGYQDWVAYKSNDEIEIFRLSSELFFPAGNGLGMNDYEYYNMIYNFNNQKHKEVLKREDCYKLVEKYYERFNGVNITIKDHEIEERYELDIFYSNVKNWGELRWR